MSPHRLQGFAARAASLRTARFHARPYRLLGGGILAAAIGCMPVAQAAETIEEVVVVGSQVVLPESYAGGQVARGGRVGLFGNLDIMDSPFSSTNYTAELIQNQQATGVGDVLRNDPAVRVARGFGNFQELYVIRGFPTFSDDMTYNGLYGILPRQFVAAELLERVELFRGASSFLNGAPPSASGVGGAVNLVPKRAPDEPLAVLTAGLEGQGHGYLAFDGSRRFGENDSTGVRVNAVRRDGETAIDDQDRELSVLSLGMDYRGERLRLSADLAYQDHHIDQPRPAVTPVAGIPETPDASSNFAQPWTFTDEEQLFGVVRGEYDLTEQVSVWAAAGLREGEETNLLSNPSAQLNGDSSGFRFDNYREDSVFSADTGIKSEFTTGSVAHSLVLSASVFSLESRNAWGMGFFNPALSNIYEPTAVALPPLDFAGGVFSDPLVTQTSDTSSVALADMLSFLEDRVLLTLGGRYQNLESASFDYNTGLENSRYDESQLTPVAGLVIKTSEQVSIYGNYIEGLIPGDVAPNDVGGEPVLNAGEIFDPYQAKQIEAGVKYDRGNFGGSASLFNTALPSGYVENQVFSVNGEQRHRGLELSLFGQPLENLRVLGGLTFLDAEMVDTQNGLYDDKHPVGVPDTSINMNLVWDSNFLPGLTLDARLTYTASQYADAANTMSVDSSTLLDLGAGYTLDIGGKELELRARLANALGEDYWASVGGYPGSNYLVLGNPRTLMLSGSVSF
jgi:iron complex outermembrane receptor protein